MQKKMIIHTHFNELAKKKTTCTFHIFIKKKLLAILKSSFFAKLSPCSGKYMFPSTSQILNLIEQRLKILTLPTKQME